MATVDMEVDRILEFFRWFVTVRHPKEIINDHTSFFAVEILLYACSLLTLKHAWRNGGRYVYLWLATVFHGFAIECMSYYIPDIDNFWHAQSTIMFLGQKLPLHIICFYPVVIYTASVAVSRLKMPLLPKACAVGIGCVVLDLPWDVLGIKLLWWTFHDTDPNIADRFYWVPWTSFHFFASFMSSLTLCLHGFRKIITGHTEHQSSGCLRELTCSMLAAIFAIPLGVLQFVIFYHVPHDIYKVPTNVCVAIYLTLFVLLAWTGDRNAGTMSKLSKAISNFQKKRDELFVLVLMYYSFFAVTVFLAQPKSIFSVGLHQPIGNCTEKIQVHIPIGMVLSRNKYLCPIDYDEDYFDFHCAMQETKHWENKEWYIICGTDFKNRNEYIAVITSMSIFGFYFYYQLLVNSGRDVPSNVVAKFKLM